jgi:hypothetical protein
MQQDRAFDWRLVTRHVKRRPTLARRPRITPLRYSERVVHYGGVSLPESLVSQLRSVAGQPTAEEAEIKQAEAMLGTRLPAPLRNLYLRIGNGGFGPGYGVLGLEGGLRDDRGKTVLDTYASAVAVVGGSE